MSESDADTIDAPAETAGPDTDADPTKRCYYKAEDGATYWVVASSPKRVLELLQGSGFGDGCEHYADDLSINELSFTEAASVHVHLEDDRSSPRYALTDTKHVETDSIFSSEF